MTTDSSTSPASSLPESDKVSGRIPIGPIVAMLVCVFALGSAEYAVIGVVPEIAGSLKSTVTAAGAVVTTYAIAVAVTGPFLAAYLSRFASRTSMVWLMSVFGVGNVISATSQNLAVLLGGRVVAALALSAFIAFSITTLARIVPAARMGQAISWVAGGLILAMVLGAPVGTLIGQYFGWRATFAALALLAVVGIVALLAMIPIDSAPETTPGVLAQLKVIVEGPVLIALLFGALGQMGFFTAYTYIAPTLEEISGFSGASIALMMFFLGVGGFIGNLIGGRLVDRNLPRALVGLMMATVVALVFLSVAAPSKAVVVVALVLLGVAGFAVIPAYQMWMMRAAKGAPSALAANTSGINLGIAVGAMVGGFALDHGLSERNLGLVGAVATLGGVAVAVLAVVAARYKSPGSLSRRIPRQLG